MDISWREVTAAGVRCEAFEVGAGPPLVLAHGGLDSCAQWLPILNGLAERHRCLVIERPSNGASDEFAYEAFDGDPRSHMARVMADIWDGLGLEHAPVVANSMGGLFAMAFAAAHPERVDQLILVGAPAGSEDHPLPNSVRGLVNPVLSSLVVRLMERSTPESGRKFMGRDLVVHPERIARADLEIGAATARANARRWRRFARWVVDGRQVRSDVGFDDIVAAIRAPTTIVWGARDAFGTVPAGERLAVDLGADFHVVDDAGHLPWYDDPSAVTRMILDATAN